MELVFKTLWLFNRKYLLEEHQSDELAKFMKSFWEQEHKWEGIQKKEEQILQAENQEEVKEEKVMVK